jgi:antimicrobial peptide system SdpB family protein
MHWWISFSFMTTVRIVDGGDQVTAILALLLIPVTLTDLRRWHWDRPEEPSDTLTTAVRQLLALSSLGVARIQVSIVYFESAVAKLRVPEWTDGTAIYYWFTDPRFGAAPWLRPIIMPLIRNSSTVVALTWGPILLEVLLFTGLVIDKRYRKHLLVAGIAFHAGIALVHGLGSFAIAMWAALILYLYPSSEQFVFLYKPYRIFAPPKLSPQRAAGMLAQAWDGVS